MTRLTHTDIAGISPALTRHDNRLRAATGKGLLGIAAHAWGVEEDRAAKALSRMRTQVIPVTAGQGVITDFSATVAEILTFIGVPATVGDRPDVQGLTQALGRRAHAVFMADDVQFAGLHLAGQRVADNTFNTGKIYAAALDLMTNGIKDHPVLIMGCGPVGESAAFELMARGARLALYDIQPARTHALAQKLMEAGAASLILADHLETILPQAPHVVEATPSAHTLPLKLARQIKAAVAPGVPQGAPPESRKQLGRAWLHDKLELGVAAMAVELIQDQIHPHHAAADLVSTADTQGETQ